MEEYLSVALPKGRLGEKVLALFREAGIADIDIANVGRKLCIEDESAKLRFILVKPYDSAVFVERGAADIGVCGYDVLVEQHSDVYELLDLGFGKCAMCVAAPKDFVDEPGRPLRVATKYASAAEEFFTSKGRDIDIIKLNGSIEPAPILGLSDVIFDIVETGSTLKENHLEVVEKAFDISARFIANKSSFNFKNDQIMKITALLSDVAAKI